MPLFVRFVTAKSSEPAELIEAPAATVVAIAPKSMNADFALINSICPLIVRGADFEMLR